MQNPSSEVAQRLQTIHARIKEGFAQTRLKTNSPPLLIAVSKGQSEQKIHVALGWGQRDFGENRVQEAVARWQRLKAENPDIKLHLIGPLQTNKVKEAVPLFDVIHTLDRARLADRLFEEMQKQSRFLPCFIQINTGEEPQKSGVTPYDAPEFLSYCKKLGLDVTGLMCIPPMGESPAPHFALLYKMAIELKLSHLSMGMSADFETAIRFGATHVRLGTAIFGERE